MYYEARMPALSILVSSGYPVVFNDLDMLNIFNPLQSKEKKEVIVA